MFELNGGFFRADKMGAVMKSLITSICLVVIVLAGTASGASESIQVVTNTLAAAKTDSEPTGPTVFLAFNGDSPKDNSISAFMYFVPMISTVPVDAQVNPANQQRVRIVSCKRKSTSKSFEVVCEFEMQGPGYHRNTFDAAEVISEMKESTKANKPLSNLIDYIMFEGSGRGSIKVKGRIVKGIEKVSSVKVTFNEDGNKSPVTVGLYTVKSENGHYAYENRSGKTVARVNTLTFKDGQSEPTMEIGLASVRSSKEKDSLCSMIKGRIANLFIKPIKVSHTGNDAMMDFGCALYKKHASFTFPKAKNLKIENKADSEEETVVARAAKGKARSNISAN